MVDLRGFAEKRYHHVAPRGWPHFPTRSFRSSLTEARWVLSRGGEWLQWVENVSALELFQMNFDGLKVGREVVSNPLCPLT